MWPFKKKKKKKDISILEITPTAREAMENMKKLIGKDKDVDLIRYCLGVTEPIIEYRAQGYKKLTLTNNDTNKIIRLKFDDEGEEENNETGDIQGN